MVSEQYKICFLIPWYGEFPWWMEYFLKSVESNTMFNWILISENRPAQELPRNMKFVEFTLENLHTLIYQKTGLEPNIENPYKLCDFKPSFGIIFSDLLKDFDYWGYCDIDLVFGDLSRFLQPYLEEGFDVLSPDEEFFPGHFCLFRNTSEINNLFKTAISYVTVLTSSKVFFFDEFLFKKGISCSKKSIEKVIKSKIEKHKRLSRLKKNPLMRILRKPFRMLKTLKKSKAIVDFNSALEAAKVYENFKVAQKTMYLSDVELYCRNIKSWTVHWDVGKLFHKNELLYFHFQMSKARNDFRIIDTGKGFELKLTDVP